MRWEIEITLSNVLLLTLHVKNYFTALFYIIAYPLVSVAL